MFTDTQNHSAREGRGRAALRRWVCLAGAAGMLFGADRVAADEVTPIEYQVKSAFLVKFALFIEWPAPASGADTNAPFVIGILGKDPFGKKFDDAVKQERIDGRPVEVRRGSELSDLTNCPVIFICASESRRMEELIAKLVAQPVLTVADEPQFAKRGGMIGFIKENGKVRFEINIAAAERAGLKLSAKLLQVGKIVAPFRGRAGG